MLLLLLLACTHRPPASPAPTDDTEDPVPTDTEDPVPTDVEPPAPPAGLQRWMTGDEADADVPTGPGLLLVGGGSEPDDAFRAWMDLFPGGDVVVLRASGSDGYNPYLYEDLGGIDSVETLLVDRRALAEDPYPAWRIDQAEAVFVAGGDQSVYLTAWTGTPMHDALRRLVERGAALGGTSAGLAILGDRAYSATVGSVTSDEALADPYHPDITFQDGFLPIPRLAGTVTDTHFHERDRMGRLVTFVARMTVDGLPDPRGLGVDEATALLVLPTGESVHGPGAVYEVRGTKPIVACSPGQPLAWEAVEITRRTASGTTTYGVRAKDGGLRPADPY